MGTTFWNLTQDEFIIFASQQATNMSTHVVSGGVGDVRDECERQGD
jgi:hypothetical protein